MHPTRLLARPMLGGVFVSSGLDVLRNPAAQAAKAEPVATELASRLGLPKDPELLVRVNAAVQVVAGSLLSIGKFRRLSAAALMASLVPTTYAGHRFWEAEDPKERKEQRIHLSKNVAILGGLLLELVDTEGRPSLTWKSRRAARHAAQAASAGASVARGSKKAAKGSKKAAKGSKKAARSVAASKGAEALRHAASDQLGKGKDLAGNIAKVKALKEITERALPADFDMAKATRELAGKAAEVKLAKAAARRMAS